MEPSTTSNFLNNFPNGIALPERIYDISSVYMMNDKKDYLPGVKSFADYSVYSGNFPSISISLVQSKHHLLFLE